MLKYAVVDRWDGSLVEIMSDRNWKDYDTRVYEIMHYHKFKEKFNRTPISVIKALKFCKSKKELEEIYYPVFESYDLDNVFISKSGHLVLKKELTTQQQLWINLKKEGDKLIE